MTAVPLAHTGHWLINVLYLVPLVIIIGMLGVSSLKDRRAEAAEAAAAPSPAAKDPPADEHAAP